MSDQANATGLPRPNYAVAKNGHEYVVAPGYEWFWEMFAKGTWEPSTFEVFDRFIDADTVVADIGAWIGPTALYAAKRAKQVFAFEPDPVAFHFLASHLRLNGAGNVVAYPVAVAREWCALPFGRKGQLGDSMSSTLWAEEGSVPVPAVSLESVVLDLGAKFIKIDIEGGERDIFDQGQLALKECQPTIHLSLHTPWFTGDELAEYRAKITKGLEPYTFFYDENLRRIDLADAFDEKAFNAVVATFEEIR